MREIDFDELWERNNVTLEEAMWSIAAEGVDPIFSYEYENSESGETINEYWLIVYNYDSGYGGTVWKSKPGESLLNLIKRASKAYSDAIVEGY